MHTSGQLLQAICAACLGICGHYWGALGPLLGFYLAATLKALVSASVLKTDKLTYEHQGLFGRPCLGISGHYWGTIGQPVRGPVSASVLKTDNLQGVVWSPCLGIGGHFWEHLGLVTAHTAATTQLLLRHDCDALTSACNHCHNDI